MTASTAGGSRHADRAFAEELAPTWERRREDIERVSAPVSEWLLAALRPSRGETVLEVAAGIGDTGFRAAAMVGATGRLITSDVSPGILDGARRRGEQLRAANVEYRLMDAERMDLATGSVDGALCRFGYMLMDDPAAALAETGRVLRPGGRLALAVWAAPERTPFFTAAAIALVRRGHLPPPRPDGPGIFALADEGRLTELLRDAGFGGVRAEEVSVRLTFPDIGEYVRLVADAAGPVAIAMRRLAEKERGEVTEECRAALEGYARDGGYEIPGAALCATGVGAVDRRLRRP